MKLKTIPSILALALGILLGFGVYTVAGSDRNAALGFVGSAVSFFVALLFTIGISYDDGRLGVSIQVLGALALVVMLISHFAFAIFGISQNAYIIVNGIILLLFLAIFYGVYKARQD